MRVVVVGAGIAGISAALDLLEAGAQVTLVDAATRLGGKIVTEHAEGFTIEHGPDSFVAYRPAALELATQLGLAGRLIGVQEPRSVDLHLSDDFVPLPDGMGLVLPTRLGPFARTRLFTLGQKLRAAADLVMPPTLGTPDVAIGAFLRRRLGDGVVERLADPLLGGIYGTSIDELSLDSVLPQLRTYSQQSRSLLVASWRAGKAARRRGPGQPFRSLSGGLGELVDAAADRLRAHPDYAERLGGSVLALHQDSAVTNVQLPGDKLIADALVIATPAPATAALLEADVPGAAQVLREIPHGSTAVVTLGFAPGSFERPLAGHGFLEAGANRSRTSFSGCTFSSGKWPGRAPAGHDLIRAFLPHRARWLSDRSDSDVFAAVERDLAGALGRFRTPVIRRITRWPAVMPRYTVGHAARLERIDQAMAARPAWRLAGASYRGVGLPDCIASGRSAAAGLIQAFG